jgi:7,8-dihydroneopterin aldolase/epimerase/oxygenase
MSIVALEHMRFFAHHGVYAEEQREGNHFSVDLWMDTGDLPLPQHDALAEAIDYSAAYAVVSAEMAVRANLLETLCARIGKRLLAEQPQVRSVRVRVSKEAPPLGGPCARSFVEHTFDR